MVIYGGFPNSGSPALTDRNPRSFSSILSGDIGEIGDRTDNTQAVVASGSVDNTAELGGFVIRDGYSTTNAGGGVCNGTSSPVLRNLVITGNTAVNGGGMANLTNSHPQLINCVLSGNSATTGGGVCNTASSNPQLVNCTLSGNIGDNGGGIVNGSFCRASLLNCIIWNNGVRRALAARRTPP